MGNINVGVKSAVAEVRMPRPEETIVFIRLKRATDALKRNIIEAWMLKESKMKEVTWVGLCELEQPNRNTLVGLALKESIEKNPAFAPKKGIRYGQRAAIYLPNVFDRFNPSQMNNVGYGTVGRLIECGLELNSLEFKPVTEVMNWITDHQIDEVSAMYFGDMLAKEKLRAYAREILKLAPVH
jgi:hypothetical protein